MIYPEGSGRFRTNFTSPASPGQVSILPATAPIHSPPLDASLPVVASLGDGFGSDSTDQFSTGTSPLVNEPGVRTYPLQAEPYQAEVYEAVGDSDTEVLATLVEDGTTVTATLLLPYNTGGSAAYTPADCVPQYAAGDLILVFHTRDTDEWLAPGPFIPKEVIKAIFTCPS